MCHPIHEYAVPSPDVQVFFCVPQCNFKVFLKIILKCWVYSLVFKLRFCNVREIFSFFISSNLLVHLWKLLTTFDFCFAMFWIRVFSLVLFFVSLSWIFQGFFHIISTNNNFTSSFLTVMPVISFFC